MTIKDLINASGLTQAAFAERFHIPLRSVENWVTGKRTPPEYVPFLISEIIKKEGED